MTHVTRPHPGTAYALRDSLGESGSFDNDGGVKDAHGTWLSDYGVRCKYMELRQLPLRSLDKERFSSSRGTVHGSV